MNQPAPITCGTSIHRTNSMLSVTQGSVESSGSVSIQVAVGILFWQIARFFGLISVQVSFQSKSDSNSDHRPPSHPISKAVVGFAIKQRAFDKFFFSISNA